MSWFEVGRMITFFVCFGVPIVFAGIMGFLASIEPFPHDEDDCH